MTWVIGRGVQGHRGSSVRVEDGVVDDDMGLVKGPEKEGERSNEDANDVDMKDRHHHPIG